MKLPELPANLDESTVARVIHDALAEDLGTGGDITSLATIPEDTKSRAVFAAREEMVVAGLAVAGLVFFSFTGDIDWQPLVNDGDRVGPGDTIARIAGPARALLAGERTALNILQHLSGIATATRAYVDAVAGTGALIMDTRKTIPGLRELAKYATSAGGAINHRMRLDDAVLIKDNHIAAAGGITPAIKGARNMGLGPIEVECDTIEQALEAVQAGVDIVLLDNMDPPTLARAVGEIAGRARTEASGGVNLANVREIAETGVDAISIGRITQSAPAVDIGLDWDNG